MKKIFLFSFILFSFLNCKKHGECVTEEPLLKADFYEKTHGSSLSNSEMTNISIQGVGSGTVFNNTNILNYSYPNLNTNSILIPLNIAVDSAMFIIKNNTVSDTVLFHYNREHELLKRNCNQKGGYVIRAKGVSLGFSTLDSVVFNKQNNEITGLSIYY